jgi:hypothetical protein
MGVRGNFESPRTYQEKVQFRKLYGNHEHYALMADKYRVRRYIADRVGSDYLIPLLGVYSHLTRDIFDTLPDRFVMKANHGCKWNRIVWDKAELDIPATVRYFNRLMKKHYGGKSCEYHYRLIEPRILAEQLLVDGDDVPADYNFFCYHGRNGFDYAIAIDSPRTPKAVHFDKHWNVLEGEFTADEAARLVNPPNFDEMVRVAEALSRGFDFVRIDLYNVAGRVYFGEVTCTPAGGLGPVENELRAHMRNEMWELDADNRQLYHKPIAA